MLLRRFVALLEVGWRRVFVQHRTRHRAIEHALAITAVAGRRTISRAILALGCGQVDWTADYRLFSRREWTPAALFAPVAHAYLQRYPETQAPIGLALDDTALARAGTHVPHARWQRDPLSPPFHINFIHALRFVQVSLIFPHHQEGDYGARAIPVRFVESVAVTKPRHNASDQERASYRTQCKKKNLVADACAVMRDVREDFDRRGARQRVLIFAVDGSYCNRTTFAQAPERSEVLARARKDATLCHPAPPGSRRFYGETKFTPEQVRHNDAIPYRSTTVSIGAVRRELRYKEVNEVLWQGGARRRVLRLIVIAPSPYKLSPNSRIQYRQPAYLLITDLIRSAPELIQLSVDRWQIEVNHREEKEILGVGEAQVWSENSVGRHPAFRVASYSMLLLAGLLEFGIPRTAEYLPLPRWQKRAPKRASILDLLSRLRVDLQESPLSDPGIDKIADNLVRVAYG